MTHFWEDPDLLAKFRSADEATLTKVRISRMVITRSAHRDRSGATLVWSTV